MEENLIIDWHQKWFSDSLSCSEILFKGQEDCGWPIRILKWPGKSITSWTDDSYFKIMFRIRWTSNLALLLYEQNVIINHNTVSKQQQNINILTFGNNLLTWVLRNVKLNQLGKFEEKIHLLPSIHAMIVNKRLPSLVSQYLESLFYEKIINKWFFPFLLITTLFESRNNLFLILNINLSMLLYCTLISY